MAKLSKTKFKPRQNRFVNTVLIVNVLLFAAYALNLIETKLAIKLAILLTATLICFWVFLINRCLVIEVTPDHVNGPSGFWLQRRIKIADVDLSKTRNNFYETTIWQCVSIFSVHGEKICVYPFFLTQNQMRKIIALIEDYRRAGPENIAS